MPKGKPLSLNVRPPQIVSREMAYPRRDIWVLLAVCGVVRLAFSPLNTAEYTDGVLQARQFVDPIGIWPPLYSALIYPLKFIIGEMWAGRLISVAASTLAIAPIYRMTRRAFGTRAALYAGVFYIVAPVANRWGVRLMSDATFSLFFWWACERFYFASDEREKSTAWRAFGLGCLATSLACLTRFQGLLLVPAAFVFAGVLIRRFKAVPWRPGLWLLGVLLLPIWVWLTSDSFIHGKQFSDRAFQAQIPLWKVISLNGEAFLAYLPYFLTYSVAIMALIGMFWTRQRRGNGFAWMTVYVAVVLIVVQSAFSSFQERYLLPLMGFFWVLAGSGMYAVQERWLRQRHAHLKRLFPYLLIMVYGWSALWLFAVSIGQREAFGDIARASRAAAEAAPEGAPIYTNEVYRHEPARIAGNKVAFFSKREAVYLNENFIPADPFRQGNSGPVPRKPVKELPSGSIVVLSDIYGGDFHRRYLGQIYDLELVGDPHTASILPLMPDIMSADSPGGAQNPMAWLFRYNWQVFRTNVYRIEGRR